VRKSFCRTNFWRRFLVKLKCMSSWADLRFGTISWWITVGAAQDALGNHYQGRREEIDV